MKQTWNKWEMQSENINERDYLRDTNVVKVILK
jgi:hypothetical protein